MSFLTREVLKEIETGLTSGDEDRIWKAAVRLGDFVEEEPGPVWELVEKWGAADNAEVRMAIATCVLEHLLEHHFDRFFAPVERLAMANYRFADTFSSCWNFGQSEDPTNAERMGALREQLRRRHGAA